MTAAELRVLEARMDTLNAMLQDLVYQARRLQASTAQRRQAVSDLFGPPSFRVHWCDGHLVQDRSLLNSLAPSEAFSRRRLPRAVRILRKRGSMTSAIGDTGPEPGKFSVLRLGRGLLSP